MILNELRMDRSTFGLLCDVLHQDERVKKDGLVSLDEHLCMTLQILAHYKKNCIVDSRIYRSRETITRHSYFNSVLQGILLL